MIGITKSALSEVLISISPITSIYCALVPLNEELSIHPYRVVFLNIFTSAALLCLFGGLLLAKRKSLRQSLVVASTTPPQTVTVAA